MRPHAPKTERKRRKVNFYYTIRSVRRKNNALRYLLLSRLKALASLKMKSLNANLQDSVIRANIINKLSGSMLLDKIVEEETRINDNSYISRKQDGNLNAAFRL